MTQEEVIRRLIEKEGSSLRAFSEKINIPYSTFHSILQRGVEKAGVTNVIKICKGLGITVEELEEMANKNTLRLNRYPETIAAHADEELTAEEQKEVKKYIDYLISQRNK